MSRVAALFEKFGNVPRQIAEDEPETKLGIALPCDAAQLRLRGKVGVDVVA